MNALGFTRFAEHIRSFYSCGTAQNRSYFPAPSFRSREKKDIDKFAFSIFLILAYIPRRTIPQRKNSILYNGNIKNILSLLYIHT